MKKILFCLLLFAFAFNIQAQEFDSAQAFIDSLESKFHYQTGEIKIGDDIGTLSVPKGFAYVDPEQSQYVIHDLWGNPGGEGTLGMLVPENGGVMHDESWAFIITYDESGYVEDGDADDIDYEELLTQMREDGATWNEERKKQGYEPIELVGWASTPYYDADKKVLYWAKELKFGEAELNTLNYDVRILGRKGHLQLQAVAGINQLATVQQNIPSVLTAFNYAEGKRYSDFDPDIDEVAAWTIGGLVAGKVLAKAGFFAVILKNIKLIGIAVMAAITALWKLFKKKVNGPDVRDIGGTSDTPQA
ncbi:DUF2167 domain-containing protein [Pseudochryseolinea flava]|uniref:DUF2167 domain-containing protein n=1 Tax=Pseudochryseolinea flava TaxID=2059302 RepID=A0A364Y3V2_9BACT|nr:DUF2167 domain-containing protein [Pseudochryseolinea flava]RAW01630.1 DUF2167 domain-containing protein [Pseudochryseolinea flava]